MSELKEILSTPIEGELPTLKEALDLAVAKAEREIEEIRSTGAGVKRVEVRPDGTIRYHLAFPPDTQQRVTREKLAILLFDVGQKIGATGLAFYAAKRVTKTAGWSV